VSGELIGPLLQSVSRSFYLSIRFLPEPLRGPVGLAYLLARATDTIADTHQIPVEVRKPKLEVLASVIQASKERRFETAEWALSKRPSLSTARELADQRTSYASLQTNEAERTLIEKLPQCLEMLERVSPEDRARIREVVGKITRAQLLDLERFGAPGTIHALETIGDLNEYTYLIAGCVGEFWTHVCVHHLKAFADRPNEEMLALGRHYGAGLQLINILRDAGGDLRAGRCYLPNEDLIATGLTPDQILSQPKKFMPIFNRWLSEAHKGIEAGMKYALSIQSRRVRIATALPALIGARTIALLRDAGDAVLEEKIKVPRDEVRRMLRTVALTLGSKAALERMFRNAL
jgi:farnesyl-diphosphate farnesyltransferase